MKILFVTPYLPSPPRFGAQRRLDGLMRGLAETHEVSLLSFVADDEHAENSLRITKDFCATVTTVQNDVLGLSMQKKRLMQFGSLISPRSFEYGLYRDSRFQAAIDSELRRTHYDLVQVEFSHLGLYDYATAGSKKPILILDEHNIEYDLIKRTAMSKGSAIRRLYSSVNWRKFRREERDAWRRFDGVVLTSDRDEAVLQKESPRTSTAVVPNAVDLDSFRTESPKREPGTLLFFGAMNYHPNIHGVEYFVTEVLPKIVTEIPNVTLRIVGQQPPDSIRAMAGPNVDVVGFVDDPRLLLESSAVMVVPLLIGGGTRFKIVEGMAMSVPMVSTYIGAEGLEVEHEKHLLLADDADGLARETIRLLRDSGLGQRLGAEARRLAERRYGWGQAVRTLEGFCSTLRQRRDDD